MNGLLIGILAYVCLQLAVGVIVSRRVKTEDDYLLAGRSLGYGMAIFTIFATWFGAETCVGAAGAIYQHGLSGGSADPFGYALCILFMGAVFAAALWRRKYTTVADLFRERYSPWVERVAVLIIVPSSLFWAAAQIRAFGQILSAVSDVNLMGALGIAAGVTIIYTAFGGMRADVVTDLIQGIAIILGLVVLFVVVMNEMGGVAEAVRTVPVERWNPFAEDDASWPGLLEAWLVPICGSVVAQELVARVLAARSIHVARRATLAGGGLYLLIGLIPAFLGLVGFSLIPKLDEPEQILPALAAQYLPTVLFVLFAGALVSAILSTIDSTLLACSALISHNLIARARPALSEAAKVRVARLGVVGCGIAAWLMALRSGSIYELVESASAFGSGGIFVIFAFGLLTRFGGPASGLGAMLAGALVWAYGEYVGGWSYPFIGSLASAALVYVALARWGRQPGASPA